MMKPAAMLKGETLAAALDYGERGWPVLPLHTPTGDGCSCRRSDCGSVGKHPRVRHGSRDATADAAQVATWFQMWPDANVGIATGAGLVVLDVDPRHGGDESLAELEREHGRLPETVRDVTGGGGAHYIFGGAARNSAGALAPGLDLRGDGGFIVAPPSLHVSGRRYEWDVEPGAAPVAPLPAWLTPTPTDKSAPVPASEWRQLATSGAELGGRNNATARLAGHLLRRRVDPFVVLELVVAWDARNRPPLGREEVTRTVASIARREAERRV